MNRKRTEPTEATHELDAALLHNEIARLAHAFWEERGCGDGSAEQDWLEAERQLQETQLREPLGLQTKSQAA